MMSDKMLSPRSSLSSSEIAMEKLKRKRPALSKAELIRRGDEFLKSIQQELMPAHATEFIAINLETGEYILSKTPVEATERFWARWPDVLMFLCRVDGGPAYKFYGK
jgi:hypothetical protein